MKRSSKASFMPNVVVFPGGSIEEADCSPAWLNTFREFGMSVKQLDELRTKQTKRPFIFDADHSIHTSDGSTTAAIDRFVIEL